MRLADILTVDRVTTCLSATDKDGALRAMSGLFDDLDPNEIYRVLSEREALASTGIGSGVAIPHARIGGIDQLRAALALCPQGVDFDSVDGLPVRIAVVILAPERSTGEHLKALAHVSRVLRSDGFREALLSVDSPEEAFRIATEQDERSS